MSKSLDIVNILRATEIDNTNNNPLISNTNQLGTNLDSAAVQSIPMQYFETLDSLPLTNLSLGLQAFVEENKRHYVSNGSGWYNTGYVISSSPYWVSDPSSTYEIVDSATPLIVIAKPQDSDNPNLINQSFGSDSALYMATISNDSSVFTFTPKTKTEIGTAINAGNLTDSNGDFIYTFKWSDGTNFVAKAVTITYNTVNRGPVLKWTIPNPNNYTGSGGDYFGSTIAMSDTYTVIGVPNEDTASNTGDGVAYIFENSTGNLVRTISNPNPNSNFDNDNFGKDVGINNNGQVLISTPNEDDWTSYLDVGKAYVYNISTGSLVYTFSNPNHYGSPSSDQFGLSSDMDDDHVIVGARLEEESGSSSDDGSGKAYIFRLSNGSLRHSLTNPNAYGTRQSDIFGNAVAIKGNYAIVGAHQEDDAGGSSSGAAYVFNVSTGNVVYSLTNPNAQDTSNYDQFGYRVAISDNYFAVSAYSEKGPNPNNYEYSGAVYVYDISTGNLLHTLENPNPTGTEEYDYFGFGLAINDKYVVCGTPYEDTTGDASGVVYVFDITNGNLLHTIDNPNAQGVATNDRFGQFVAASDGYISATAPNDFGSTADSNGTLYIWDLP